MDVWDVMLDKNKKYLFFSRTFNSLNFSYVLHDVFGSLINLIGGAVDNDLNHRIYLIY